MLASESSLYGPAKHFVSGAVFKDYFSVLLPPASQFDFFFDSPEIMLAKVNLPGPFRNTYVANAK